MKAASGRALARLLNRWVGLDPQARKRLRPLQGRSLGVALRGPELRFVLAVVDGQFELQDPEQAEAQAWIKASPGSLVALAATGGSAPGTQVEMSGDADTARRFQQAFAALEPDLEEGFARAFGEVAGVHLFRALSAALTWCRRTGTALAETTSDYWREESRQLISRPELEGFLDAVDDLRDDVARLEAQLNHLGSRHL